MGVGVRITVKRYRHRMVNWVTGALLWAVSLSGNGTGTALPNQPVSLVVDEVPAGQVLQALVQQSPLSLVVAPGISGNLSLQLQDVPWNQVLEIVTQGLDAHWILTGNVLQIVPDSHRREQQARLAAERQQRKQQAPLVGLTIGLRHAQAGELSRHLIPGGPYLSASGSVIADERTNRLLLRDTRAAIKRIQQWVSEMDIPVSQVELVAHIVTISQDSLRDLGVKWSRSSGKAERPSRQDINLSVPGASSRLGFTIGRLSGRMLELELSALERKRQLEIIASPRLLASHRQPASIKQGSEIPYQVSVGDKGATSVTFKDAVLGMVVTPFVLPGRRVRLKLHISQNMPGQKLQYAQGEALTIDKQEIETEIELLDGETVALGGIFQQKKQSTRGSVPLLAAVPLLGHLFRHDGKTHQRYELVVFITPRLLDAG